MPEAAMPIKPLVLMLEHNVEEGEYVPNVSKEELAKMLNLDVHQLNFDFEEEVANINPFEPKDYCYKKQSDADNYDELIIEDRSDDEERGESEKYKGTGSDSFPSYEEMYSQLNDDLIKERVAEDLREGKIPKSMSKEQIAEARKSWFKIIPRPRKFRRTLAFFTRDKDVR